MVKMAKTHEKRFGEEQARGCRRVKPKRRRRSARIMLNLAGDIVRDPAMVTAAAALVILLSFDERCLQKTPLLYPFATIYSDIAKDKE